MSDDQIEFYLETIRQQIAELPDGTQAQASVNVTLLRLAAAYQQMKTTLREAEAAEERLLQQNQELVERYYYYYDLFRSSPIAFLVIDRSGVILEANQAIARLLNVPQRYLTGSPFILYVEENCHLDLCNKLEQISQTQGGQIWHMTLRPREDSPFAVELHVNTVRGNNNLVEELHIGIYNLSRQQQQINLQSQQQQVNIQGAKPMTQLPYSLDGLRVLLVDDEADAREFITTVLESYGITVKAVATAAAALEELGQFQPDVLVSDLRMPGEDGRSLIRQVRELEAQNGGHIPAAAITAYLDEAREKSLEAGFEAHLHKLAQPRELIELIVQLAGHTQK